MSLIKLSPAHNFETSLGHRPGGAQACAATRECPASGPAGATGQYPSAFVGPEPSEQKRLRPT